MDWMDYDALPPGAHSGADQIFDHSNPEPFHDAADGITFKIPHAHPQNTPAVDGSGSSDKQVNTSLANFCSHHTHRSHPRCSAYHKATLNPTDLLPDGQPASTSDLPAAASTPTMTHHHHRTTQTVGGGAQSQNQAASPASGGNARVSPAASIVPSSTSNNSSSGLGTGALVAAIVVPVVVVLALIIGVFLWLRRRRRQRDATKASTLEKPSPSYTSAAPQQPRNVSAPLAATGAGAGALRTDFAARNTTSPPPQYSSPKPTIATSAGRSPFDDPSASQSSTFLTMPALGDGRLMDISPQEAAAAASTPTAVKSNADRDEDEVSAVSDDGADGDIEYGEAASTSLGAQQRASVIDMGTNGSSPRIGTDEEAEDEARRELQEEPPRW